MKKITALLLAVLMMSMLFSSCQKESPASTGSPKSITIPAVTVDLQSPENRVQVSSDEPSTVYDAAGNALTKDQWLLNSKFAKSYIRQLGVGSYTFRYESASSTGTISLTITDSQAPAYLFTDKLPETVRFFSSLTLPELVKDQDSYQDDCMVSYALKKGEETVELSDGFVTPNLTEGTYTWTAVATKAGEPYEFTQSFYVQSFAEYLTSMENELIKDNQKGEFLKIQDGIYTADASSNTLDYYFSVNHEVLELAVEAGMETFTFTVTVEEPLIYESTGSIWISNNWNGFVFGLMGTGPETIGTLPLSPSNLNYGKVYSENGKYIYQGTVYLSMDVFTIAQPLTLQFNYAKCIADITVEFQ